MSEFKGYAGRSFHILPCLHSGAPAKKSLRTVASICPFNSMAQLGGVGCVCVCVRAHAPALCILGWSWRAAHRPGAPDLLHGPLNPVLLRKCPLYLGSWGNKNLAARAQARGSSVYGPELPWPAGSREGWTDPSVGGGGPVSVPGRLLTAGWRLLLLGQESLRMLAGAQLAGSSSCVCSGQDGSVCKRESAH